MNGLEARIAAQITPTLTDLGYDLVRLSVLGRETPTIQIMADRADGSLISVDDCQQISYAIGAVLDVEDPIPGAWNLEISSAGIDRPLTRAKDWERFAGHLAKAETDLPIDGRKRFSGIIVGLREVEGRGISAIMRLDDGAEAVLALADIRKARLVLTDALIEASAALTGPSGSGDDEEPQAARRVPKLHPVKPGKGSRPGKRPPGKKLH